MDMAKEYENIPTLASGQGSKKTIVDNGNKLIGKSRQKTSETSGIVISYPFLCVVANSFLKHNMPLDKSPFVGPQKEHLSFQSYSAKPLPLSHCSHRKGITQSASGIVIVRHGRPPPRGPSVVPCNREQSGEKISIK